MANYEVSDANVIFAARRYNRPSVYDPKLVPLVDGRYFLPSDKILYMAHKIAMHYVYKFNLLRILYRLESGWLLEKQRLIVKGRVVTSTWTLLMEILRNTYLITYVSGYRVSIVLPDDEFNIYVGEETKMIFDRAFDIAAATTHIPRHICSTVTVLSHMLTRDDDDQEKNTVMKLWLDALSGGANSKCDLEITSSNTNIIKMMKHTNMCSIVNKCKNKRWGKHYEVVKMISELTKSKDMFPTYNNRSNISKTANMKKIIEYNTRMRQIILHKYDDELDSLRKRYPQLSL